MSAPDMFAPPVNRAMKALDRGFFRKTVPTAAARIFSRQDIARCRKELDRTREALTHTRISPIQPDPSSDRAQRGGKCLLLRPDVVHNDRTTWSARLRALETHGTLGVIPYQLHLDYDAFTYADITQAVLPPPESSSDDDLPTGFTMAGHVAHLNLRERYWPYKHLIAAVLADKNPMVRTVINKLDSVGAENQFRTFQYEVLHGPDDLNVSVHEQGCTFNFDFAKVYWNTRLHTEHERLCSLFEPGDAVCDVMAGVGPFAVPAGKKKCFVYANDLNPASHQSLVDNISANRVGQFVRPFNVDGSDFIRTATADLLSADHAVTLQRKPKKGSRSNPSLQQRLPPAETLTQPKLFAHYVMNLPASAITFLPSFVGLYASVPGVPASEIRNMFAPHTQIKLPLVHVHCFGTKSEDNVAETREICAEVSRLLVCEMRAVGVEEEEGPNRKEINDLEEGEVIVHDVRDVAPKKRMFCASLRLPAEVVFRGA